MTRVCLDPIATKLSQAKLLSCFLLLFVGSLTSGERLLARVHGISFSWCTSNVVISHDFCLLNFGQQKSLLLAPR